MKSIRIYFKAFKIALAERMAYRWNFFISFSMMLLSELIAPLLMIIIYRKGASFPGWGLYEVLLLQGIFTTARGTGYTFFNGTFYNTTVRVQEGTFDLLLLKPLPAVFTSLIHGFTPEETGVIFGGIGLSAYALFHLPPASPGAWAGMVLFFVIALTVLLSFTLIMTGTVFRWVGNYRIHEIFENLARFGLYPGAIFPRVLRVIIAFIIPVGLLGAIPAGVFLGKPVPTLAPVLLGAGFFFLFSLLFWYGMLRQYTSAGG